MFVSACPTGSATINFGDAPVGYIGYAPDGRNVRDLHGAMTASRRATRVPTDEERRATAG